MIQEQKETFINRIEPLILKNLIENDDYSRKVLPFLKDSYFSDPKEKIIFTEITKFIHAYNTMPTYDAVSITIHQLPKLSEDTVKGCDTIIAEMKGDTEKTDQKWLIDTTETLCKERAMYNALQESIVIYDGKSKKTRGEIPEIVKEALAVCFDANVGHNYWEDADARYDAYHRKERKIPFQIDYLNKITKGGVEPKTMNVIMGGIGVGKTLLMCSLATGYIVQGYNVLYITLEMGHDKIAERIDANLLNIPLEDLEIIPKDVFLKKVEKARQKQVGKFYIKEYPTSCASILNFKALLNDLALKQNFRPDVIFVDYLGICASSRMKVSENLYAYGKVIAEELRGFAQEAGVALWTGVQVNRKGYADSEPDMDSIAESFGIPATSDFFIVITTTEQLEQLGQYATKQLKNRYNSKQLHRRFVLGVDYTKMRVYDCEDDSQTLAGPVIVPSKPQQNNNNHQQKFQGIKV